MLLGRMCTRSRKRVTSMCPIFNLHRNARRPITQSIEEIAAHYAQSVGCMRVNTHVLIGCETKQMEDPAVDSQATSRGLRELNVPPSRDKAVNPEQARTLREEGSMP